MCNFLSAIVTRDNRILFCEDPSHETIIQRANLRDDNRHIRSWVRVECVPGPDWAFPAVRVDETSVPAWYEDDRIALDDKVRQLALRVAPAEKLYNDTCAPARKLYDDTCAPAEKLYNDTCAPAEKLYNDTCAPARKLYDDTCATAEKLYNDTIRTIEGYVPA